LRSDSIIVEEPIQIEELANCPPWLATILEDGYNRGTICKTEDRCGRHQRHGEPHASRPRPAYQLLGIVDGPTMSRAGRKYPRASSACART
jgi:hypothetical protein